MVWPPTRMGEGFAQDTPHPFHRVAASSRPLPQARGEGTTTLTAPPALSLRITHTSSFPRRAFARGLLQPCSDHPNRGVAERRETFGCGGTRKACAHASKTRVNALVTPHARHLRGALRPIARQDARERAYDAGRSPLGAPPWRFWAPGPRFDSPALAPDRIERAPRTQVVVPGRRLPEPPGASGYEPPPQDATPRSAFRIASRTRPQ